MAQSKDSNLSKILCIHGYRQDGPTFRERTGSLRKIFKKYAELVYISAPNKVPPLEGQEGDGKNVDQRGWWFSRSDDFFRAQDESECDKGYNDSLKTVQDAFVELGPFDGVLGFSQGASLLSLMCGMLQQQGADCPFQFGFAILIAGFKSRSVPHHNLYTSAITLPTLHVFGETDRVIEKEMSEDLLQHFTDTTVLVHEGGHFIPTSAPQKQIYVQFLTKELDKKKQSSES